MTVDVADMAARIDELERALSQQTAHEVGCELRWFEDANHRPGKQHVCRWFFNKTWRDDAVEEAKRLIERPDVSCVQMRTLYAIGRFAGEGE